MYNIDNDKYIFPIIKFYFIIFSIANITLNNNNNNIIIIIILLLLFFIIIII